MKRLLLGSAALIAVIAAGPAGAADLPRGPVYKAPPPPVVAPVPYFTWTGCYIGGHVGGGWGRKDFSDTPTTDFVGDGSAPETIRAHIRGFIGGGQVGCDYQFSPNWVIGIEGDLSGADIKGSVPDPFFAGKFHKAFHSGTDWLANVTGRVGWVWNRWMLYAKGGAAWAHDRYNVDGLDQFCTPICGRLVPFNSTASETRAGWIVGAGIEWAFWNNWSAKLEYEHYGFGRRDLTFTCANDSGFCGLFGPTNIQQNIDAVKFGVNYRFGWGKAPVVARY